MNTFQNLIDNGIEPHTAQDMLNNYSSKIGTMNGIYEITDITYDFTERGRDVTLKCSLCGREIHRMMINGRNKWSKLIKSCPCQKVAEEKRKQEEFEQKKRVERENILKDGKSMVGGEYGDYKIIDFGICEDTPTFTLECMQCGDIVKSNYQRVKTNAKTFRKCHNHGNSIKFDESYIGRKNNFLRVIGISRFPHDNHRAFLCECDCGNKKLIEPIFWERGIVKSCGCKKTDLSREASTKHGLSGTRLYSIWQGMNERCFNKKSQSYANYGGRGITICPEWQGEQGLLNFINWSENNGYSDNLTIDRINVNGNYCPENCRWADWTTQNNNRRPKEEWKERERTIEFDGKNYFMNELCEMFNTSDPAVRYRMNKLGMTLEQALTTPKMADGRPRK